MCPIAGGSARSLSTVENCQPRRGSGRASLRMMTEATMATSTDQKWSAALRRRMARLADQEMSTAQIAKALGLTRGQVLGKMHRLRLKTKNPPREATMAARTDQKWSAALIRRMAGLADQEMSAAQIAKALGLTRGQVLGKMHRLGLKTKNPPRKWLNTALVEKLTELTDQRLSGSQIGQALGLTRCQVIYRMRHLGLRMNPKTEWPAGQAEKIPELINQGLSHGGIAKALGLTRGQVLGKMRRLGLKTKNAANPKKGRRRKVAHLESAA